VDRVDLVVAAGERRALIGPNGAGKTTLFNLISGELEPTSGRIKVFGVDVSGMRPHRRAALGVARTFQMTRLFPNLTVVENVLLACEGLDRRKFVVHRRLASIGDIGQRAAGLLAEFGLSQVRDELARNLAYGDQRKLEVSLSMAGRPRLLLLDEPLAGLSTDERESMLALLKTLDPATAVLLIEHDIDVAFAFAEQVTVLYQGRVLTEGHKNVVTADRRVQEVYLGVTG